MKDRLVILGDDAKVWVPGLMASSDLVWLQPEISLPGHQCWWEAELRDVSRRSPCSAQEGPHPQHLLESGCSKACSSPGTLLSQPTIVTLGLPHHCGLISNHWCGLPPQDLLCSSCRVGLRHQVQHCRVVTSPVLSYCSPAP